jgi:hypothetical protein
MPIFSIFLKKPLFAVDNHKADTIAAVAASA